MSKILKINRDGDYFVMTVERDGGSKEKWMYDRVVTSLGVSYIEIGREDVGSRR